MTEMGVKYLNYLESNRSNLAEEAETNRANLAREAETHRSNVANETETNRSNLAKEAETHRTNVVNEGIKQGTLDEQIRTNKANEGLRSAELAEKNRSNVQNEKLKAEQNAETKRSNQAKESEQKRTDMANEALKALNSIPETFRSEAAYTEYIQRAKKENSAFSTLLDKIYGTNNLPSYKDYQAGKLKYSLEQAFNNASKVFGSVTKAASAFAK